LEVTSSIIEEQKDSCTDVGYHQNRSEEGSDHRTLMYMNAIGEMYTTLQAN
jgi:hypothetical protein